MRRGVRPVAPNIRYTRQDDGLLGKQCHSMKYAYTFNIALHKEFAAQVFLIGSWDEWKDAMIFTRTENKVYPNCWYFTLTVPWMAPYSRYRFQYEDLNGEKHPFTRVVDSQHVENFATDLIVNAPIAEGYRLDPKCVQSLMDLCVRYVQINRQYIPHHRYMFPIELANRLGLATYTPLQLKNICHQCKSTVNPEAIKCDGCAEHYYREKFIAPQPVAQWDSDDDTHYPLSDQE